MKQKTLCGRKIWITGATHGIGKAVLLKLASFGNQLAISAYPSYFEENEFASIQDTEERKKLAYEKTLQELQQLSDFINHQTSSTAIIISCD